MNKTDKDMLLRLGAGDPIQSICDDAGLTRAEFDRVVDGPDQRPRPVDGGISNHIGSDQVRSKSRGTSGECRMSSAETDDDLFVGYGYATAQDRLWQLDYYRRKARGLPVRGHRAERN